MKTVFYVAEGLCNYLFAFWRLLQQIHTIPITIVQNGDSKRKMLGRNLLQLWKQLSLKANVQLKKIGSTP